MFQKMLHFRAKTVSEVLKTWYFPFSAFWSTGHGRGGAIAPPAPLVTLLCVSCISDLYKKKGRLSSLSLFGCATESNLDFGNWGEGV